MCWVDQTRPSRWCLVSIVLVVASQGVYGWPVRYGSWWVGVVATLMSALLMGVGLGGWLSRELARTAPGEHGRHVYISTACAHGRPEDCRQRCKYCPEGQGQCQSGYEHTGEDPGSLADRLAERDRQLLVASQVIARYRREDAARRRERFGSWPVEWPVEWPVSNPHPVDAEHPPVDFDG